jgi:hypothetical protein
MQRYEFFVMHGVAMHFIYLFLTDGIGGMRERWYVGAFASMSSTSVGLPSAVRLLISPSIDNNS